MTGALDQEGVRISALGNGVRIATRDMPHLRTAAVGVWIGAGSRHEAPHEHGLAHFLEHMAFKGTATRSARQIAETIEDVGGDLNAGTGLETTGYHARVMAEDVGAALRILADITRSARFDDADVALEKGVVAQEIAAALDDAEDRATDLLQEAAFADASLGRAILGTRASVARFGPEALTRFVDAHQTGGNLVVSAAGRIDHEALTRDAERLFGDLPVAPANAMPPAAFTGGRRYERGTGDQAHLTLALPGAGLEDDAVYTHAILASALGGGLSSRLFQSIREERGLAYDVSAFHWGFSGAGLIGFDAATSEEDAPRLAAVLIAEIEAAANDLSEAETARAVAGARSGLAMSLENPLGCAERAAKQLLRFGRIIPIEESLRALEGVSAAGCRAALCDALADGRRAVAVVGPAGDAADVLAGSARLRPAA